MTITREYTELHLDHSETQDSAIIDKLLCRNELFNLTNLYVHVIIFCSS